MSLNGDESDHTVAYLTFHRNDKPDEYYDWDIAANAQFDIGRAQVQEALGLYDQCISNHHLRFHCVMYGDDELEGVPPLVYVRLLSSRTVSLIQTSSTGIISTTLLEKGHFDVLLTNGDTLKLTPVVSIEYDANYDGDEAQSLGPVQQAETSHFAQQYVVTPRKLGAGGFASVYLAMETASRRQVACKVIRLPEVSVTDGRQVLQHRLNEATKELIAERARHQKKCLDLRRECGILRSLNHPNIIRLEKAIYATHHVYIFQELVTGGDLLSYLEKKRGVPEPEAMAIVYQLLKALEYLHSKGIVHRDVKPENVLMTSWREGARVILTDFGQSRTIEDAKCAAKCGDSIARMSTIVGTPGYTAPEVYHHLRRDIQKGIGYSKAIDIWSIGCLTGALFMNQLLFPTASSDAYAAPDSDSQETVQAFDLDFLDTRPEWQHITNKAKSFIRDCVVVDEAKRLTAKQALLHLWLTHQGYAADLQGVYMRATADWKPRVESSDLIVNLNTSIANSAKATNYGARLHQGTKSRHFSYGVPPIPPFNKSGSASDAAKQRHTTLSPIKPTAAKISFDPTKPNEVAARPETTELKEAEDDSVFSVQQYAPPPMTQLPEGQNDNYALPYTTTKRTADVVDLTQDSLPLPPIECVPRKKVRV